MDIRCLHATRADGVRPRGSRALGIVCVMRRTITLSLSPAELRRLNDALDSHPDWEVAGAGERAQGFHAEPGERGGGHRACATLAARIERALRASNAPARARR